MLCVVLRFYIFFCTVSRIPGRYQRCYIQGIPEDMDFESQAQERRRRDASMVAGAGAGDATGTGHGNGDTMQGSHNKRGLFQNFDSSKFVRHLHRSDYQHP